MTHKEDDDGKVSIEDEDAILEENESEITSKENDKSRELNNSSTKSPQSPGNSSNWSNPQFSEDMFRAFFQQMMAGSGSFTQTLTEEERHNVELDKAFVTVTPTKVFAEHEKLGGMRITMIGIKLYD